MFHTFNVNNFSENSSCRSQLSPCNLLDMEPKERLSKMKEAAELEAVKLESEIRETRARIGAFGESADALGPDAADGLAVSVLRKLQEKLKKEQATLGELEAKVVDARGRAAAFEEAVKLFPKEGEEAELRPTSEMHKVREALRAAGKPMSLTDILKALGAVGDEKKRNSLRGSLASYANKGRVFTKEEQAETFGLIEFRSEAGTKTEK